MINRKSFREKFKIYLYLGLIFLVIFYFMFRISSYISGPKIKIYSPKEYQIIKDDTFIIKGNVKNAKNIYLNGREITIDENGDFAEMLIAKPPYTLITLEAIDKYGKRKSKILEIGKD